MCVNSGHVFNILCLRVEHTHTSVGKAFVFPYAMFSPANVKVESYFRIRTNASHDPP